MCHLGLHTSNLHTSLRWRTTDLIQACLLFLELDNLLKLSSNWRETVKAQKKSSEWLRKLQQIMPFQWGNCLDDESVTIRAENRKHSWLIPSIWCEMDLDIKAHSVDLDKSVWHEFLVSKPLPLLCIKTFYILFWDFPTSDFIFYFYFFLKYSY